MFIPLRRFLGITLGLVVLLGSLSPEAPGQFRPPAGPMPMNPIVNPVGGRFPMAALGQNPFVGGAALQSQALLHSPAAFGGTFRGVGRFGAGFGPFSGLGYASLLNNSGGFGLAGYGGYGLIGTAATGAALGYGYGFGYGMMGTQWMMNPYQGYLQGAASITRGNAQYYMTIQQAKLNRQAAIRSSLETRRAMIEESEWEREHMPDPEKIRQKELERELGHARVSPPPTDIWSARSLNALLRHLIAQQGEGVRGPNVPLSEDVLRHVNLSAGNTRGNVGLIKDSGTLEWPESLLRGEFQDTRERLNALMKKAYKSVTSGNNPNDATLSDLQANSQAAQKILEANVARMSPDEFIEANRYLREVKDTITALKDPNVANQFNGNWATKARNVAQLVQFMREKGLRFAPASDKDRAAYVALHHALATFDAGLPRVASTSGNSDNADNK